MCGTIDGEDYTGTVHDRGGAIRLSGKLCRIDRALDVPHDECKNKGKIDAQLTIHMNWRDCDTK